MSADGVTAEAEAQPVEIPEGALLVTDPDDANAAAARVVLYYRKGEAVVDGGKTGAQIVALVTRSLPCGAEVYCNGKRVGKANCCALPPNVYARVDLEPGVYPATLGTLPHRVERDLISGLPSVFHGEPIYLVNNQHSEKVGFISARNATVELTFKDTDMPTRHEGLHIADVTAVTQSLLGCLIRNETSLIGAVVAEDRAERIAVIAPLPNVSDTEQILELDTAFLRAFRNSEADPLAGMDFFGEDDDEDEVAGE